MTPLRGLRYLLGHPRLLSYIVGPIIINFLLTLAMSVVAIRNGRGWLDSLLSKILPPPDMWKWWHWLLAAPAWLLALLLLLVLAALIFVMLSKILAGPFNDLLSGRVEDLEGIELLGPSTSIEAAVQFSKSLFQECKKLVYYLVVVSIMLPLNLIPVAGNVLYAFFWGFFSIWFLGLEHYDYPLGRRNLDFGTRRAFARQNLHLLIGTGSGVAVILLIPLINLVMIPITVIGATLEFLRYDEWVKRGGGRWRTPEEQRISKRRFRDDGGREDSGDSPEG